jgi:hypothetical protein
MNKLYVTNKNLVKEAQLLAEFTKQVTVCVDMPKDGIFLRLD